MSKDTKKPKVSINLESLFVGEEPTFGDNNELPLARCLSWYSNQKSLEDSKKYTIDYAKLLKLDKYLIESLSNQSEDIFKNLGFVCRMTSRGANLNREDWILSRIKEISEFDKSSVKISEFSTKPNKDKNIQDRIYDICSGYISELEDHIDQFIKTKKKVEFDPYAWMIKNEVKSIHARQIRNHFIPLQEELECVHSNSDPTLTEGYSSYTKKQIKLFLELVLSIIQDCDRIISNTKLTKKPKKKKPISLDKKVSRLQYKKEDTEYKAISVSPTDIIGAKQLWVFNVKYKKLGYYVSQDDSGFGVKGTTLTGFDTNFSIQKNVRKPLDILPIISKGKRTELKNVMESINSKESLLTGRFNCDTMILRVIK